MTRKSPNFQTHLNLVAFDEDQKFIDKIDKSKKGHCSYQRSFNQLLLISLQEPGFSFQLKWMDKQTEGQTDMKSEIVV